MLVGLLRASDSQELLSLLLTPAQAETWLFLLDLVTSAANPTLPNWTAVYVGSGCEWIKLPANF